jgi:poly-gamma-glutamate capsule biosynthesis protein CapA/YwtB (metallophosphatase superfamily)
MVTVACIRLAAAWGGGEVAAVSRQSEAKARVITVVWGGDVTLGSALGQPPSAGWPLLAPLASTLRAADVAAVNYEGTFGLGGASKCGRPAPSNCFAFQAPPRNARSLSRAGIDIVNHANNHAFDYGPAGWHATRAALGAAGVAATGAPGEIARIGRAGRVIAFIGFSTYPWTAPMSDDAAVRSLVRTAAERADIVVAFFHAGAEGADRTHVPLGPEQAFGEDRGDSRRFARVAIDAGADLVLGSGPHVLRGMELYHHRLIAYSLGNLAGYHNFSTAGSSGLSALLTIAVTANGRFAGARIHPLALDASARPHRDSRRRATTLMRRLTLTDFVGGGLPIDQRGRVRAITGHRAAL